MFKDEVKNLSHYDVYILSVIELERNWQFANAEYEQGKFEIEFKNTQYPDYYLNRVSSYKNSLKNDYEIVKLFRSNIDKQTLDEYQKERFTFDKEFFEKVEKLLANMDKFLSQHNIDLTI